MSSTSWSISREVTSITLAICLALATASPSAAQEVLEVAQEARSQAGYVQILRELKFNPWHFNKWDSVFHPVDYWYRHSSEDRKRAAQKIDDFVSGKELLPEGFVKTQVTAGDLTLRAAVYLVDETPRPMIVLLPGTFGSYLSSYLGETARLIAMSGKFHVMMLATRMSVSTIQEMKVVGSGGYFEGEDTRNALRWIRNESPWASQITSIGLYGVSLSSDYVIQTMAHDEEKLVDAGMLVCGAYNPEALAAEIDRKGMGVNRLRYLWAGFFLSALRAHVTFVRDQVGLSLTDEEIAKMGLSDYGPKISWPAYQEKYQQTFGADFDYEAFRATSRAMDLAGSIQAPLLALHSHDDNWLGSAFSDQFVEQAASNPLIHLEYVDGAGHATYYIHDPAWFRDTLDTYYSYWLNPPPAAQGHAYEGAPLAPAATKQ